MNDCIVMVDDDPEDIILVKAALKRADLPVSFLALPSGESLLTFMSSNDVEADQAVADSDASYLVLLDLNMPKMDGRLCLSKLRQTQTFDDLPVVIFSTSDAYEDVEKSYALGANSHICKPDDIKELEKIMSSMYHFWLSKKYDRVGE